MKKLASTALLLTSMLGCAHRAASPTTPVEDQVTLTPLAEGVWVHTTWKTLPKLGLYPSNGLLVCEGGDGLLVDTAWDGAQTAGILETAAARGCPVRALVVTHSHDDRMGGLAEIRRRGIATYASRATVALAHVDGWEPALVGTTDEVRAGHVRAEVFFPGAAHTVDNVVVWLPGPRVLFGGCMVRALDGETLGNVADADVPAWPASIRSVIARYGTSAAHVVPGHGAAGGADLLTHTLELARAGATSPETRSVTGFAASSTTSPPPPPPPPPPTNAPCVFDAAAKRACDARGQGFSYGPTPVIYCSGVAPKPGQQEALHEAARRSACVCNDDLAVQQQRLLCSRVPSAPPRPTKGPEAGGQ